MTNIMTVLIPDIGGAAHVDVIEIFVKSGDVVTADQSLITLEGDKATMDIPAPVAGIVDTILLKTGDKVSEGTPVLTLVLKEAAPSVASQPLDSAAVPEKIAQAVSEVTQAAVVSSILETVPVTAPSDTNVISAGPAVRRLAREFGIDLHAISGTGKAGRITVDDVKQFVKKSLSGIPQSTGSGIPPIPAIDFTQFGAIETKPLNKIKRLTGINLHRAWVNVPHVTQFDEADITDLEALRKAETARYESQDYKLTLLAFVVKAVTHALQKFPAFNASLDPAGEQLIYKKYYHVGIAVDTPNGLVVPVIRNTDTLSVSEIAENMHRLSLKARQKGLMPADMSGGCFTISSLGGIGGTAFTPIVNAPEVAILGLSRSQIKPVYRAQQFEPRLMLPLSLSYDHRVIDGAEAARFTRHIAGLLEDFRRVTL